jgi:flavin reductase (DIM6/NTAB) family NADH-FMN oxidoreductase RutF
MTVAEELDTRLLWAAARRFATGVAVVTAGSADTAHGTTVSAFTFISREPALISICLKRGSVMLDIVAERGSFAVNMLASHQAPLARYFANPRRGIGAEQFHGVPWIPGLGDGVPLLIGAMCWLGCEFERRLPMGDHEFVLARVTAATSGDVDPLLYFAGRFYSGMARLKELSS